MSTTVVCPDCGGIIGGKIGDGQKPCICDMPPDSGPIPGMPEPVTKPKTCCRCGKDVAGKKRFKDSLGYWCEACHFAEKREEHTDHVPCDSCGRYVEPRKLVDYEGIKICSRCIRERKDLGKKLRRPVVFGQAHREQDKRTILIMTGVVVLLLLIIVLASLKLIPSPI